MCAFVPVIAVTGLARLPGGNPDLFVLTLPLAEGRDGLATLAFLGGFSSATSMVIVASVALATMLSNHVVVPLWLAGQGGGGEGRPVISGDGRRVALRARRADHPWRPRDGMALLPRDGRVGGPGFHRARILRRHGAGAAGDAGRDLLDRSDAGGRRGGAYRQDSRYGAGRCSFPWSPVRRWGAILSDGPWGLGWLRPEAPFGLTGDPLVVTTLLSLGVNATLLCLVSLIDPAGAAGAVPGHAVRSTSLTAPRRRAPGRAVSRPRHSF